MGTLGVCFVFNFQRNCIQNWVGGWDPGGQEGKNVLFQPSLLGVLLFTASYLSFVCVIGELVDSTASWMTWSDGRWGNLYE